MDDQKLLRHVRYLMESDFDFIGIHWKNSMNTTESLMRQRIRDKTRDKECTDECPELHWPGMAPTSILAMVRKYPKRVRFSDSFRCLYRVRDDSLAARIEELIPEWNRERLPNA